MSDSKSSVSRSPLQQGTDGPYKVTSVEEASVPDRGAEGIWHRYVIESKTSVITGCRNGSKLEVIQYADKFVEQLNARRRRLIPTSTWAKWVTDQKKG